MSWTRRFGNTARAGMRASVERRVPFWPRKWIDRLQQHRLRSIIRHAYETVPFYRRVMDERGLRPADLQTAEDLAKLPLIDGLTVRRHPEEFVSARHGESSRLALYSSGSQAHVQRTIYWDNSSAMSQLACAERDRAVLNKLLGKEWGQVRVSIMPSMSATLRLSAFWQERAFIPLGRARTHFISDELPFAVVAERLNAIRPDVAFSYGYYAEHFFRFLADRQLDIAMPRVWVYGADMLSPGGRELIEQGFGCTLYSTYQAVETGRLGFQCERRQGFHLNIDLCAVRLIDEKGWPIGPEEVGEVVISNLYNRAMVLLNYRLGDLGVLAKSPCQCGRSLPLLEHLEGRCVEVLYLPKGRIMQSLHLQGHCKHELEPTLQSQLVQLAPGKFQWRIVPFSRVDRETLRLNLLKKTRVILGDEVDLEVEYVESIPYTPQGKFRSVITLQAGAEEEGSLGRPGQDEDRF